MTHAHNSTATPAGKGSAAAEPHTPATVRSMTGFARTTGTTENGAAFTLSLKSVNHRFLDVQFHLPSGLDALEMQWRALLKQKMLRGHVDVRLTLHAANGAEESGAPRVNPAAIRAYLDAFAAAAHTHGLPATPDLNAALQMPGVWSSGSDTEANEAGRVALEAAAAAAMPALLDALNAMRAQEGAALVAILEATMQSLDALVAEVCALRAEMVQSHRQRLEQRMAELLARPLDHDRIVQEAALLADRSDVAEEMDRLRAHVQHFLALLRTGGDTGKKLDFLLQEMNREANTLLSKTGGVAGNSLRLTELGLAMKTEIERAREQVQNIE